MDLEAELGADPTEVGRARTLVADLLAEHRVTGEVAEIVVLLVSELVTNAVRHARGPIRLGAGIAPDAVRVEVADGDAIRVPLLQDTAVDQIGGRGLRLVDALSRDWGSSSAPDGKRVWFEVDRVPPP